ncbi:MAG: flavodoxin family protein [Syntrophobacteraceae bacterium]|nr:flavodoxin family protein [Syntrophobacteraceae bacterium]
MKIVSLLGSPRKRSNSSIIAGHFCTTAQKLGAESRIFTLNDLHFRGCQGCMACKTRLDRCAVEDDLTEVLEAVRETDILVLASPVYYWDVSSQMKAFVDRTFSFLVPDFLTNPIKSRLEPGKKLVLILAQNNPDKDSFTNIFPKFDYFFRAYGFTDTRLIRALGVSAPGEVESHLDVLELAEQTAKEMCGRS